MNFKYKIKGSSIQYAIITVLLIAFLLGGLVLYAGANSKLQVRFDLQERMIENVNSALEYGKSLNQELEYDKTVKVDLFGDELNEIELTKRNWGAYNYLIAEAIHPQFNFKSAVMIGSYAATNHYALYLADRGAELALCGKTEIRGHVLLPQKGVDRAYIAGQNFEGDRLINGEIGRSDKNLPELNIKYINQIQKPLLYEKQEWVEADTVQQNFLDLPKYYFSNSAISISNTVMKGQIIIESSDSIYIANSAELRDVIVKAPIIYIESGFVGYGQFFAGHKLIVAEGAVLKYPSVLALFENYEHEKASSVIVKSEAKVLGSIILYSIVNNFRKEVFLDIEPKAEVHGLAYCQGTTQLKGEINGALITNKFYLKTQSSSYENHLLNAKITSDLPDQFCVAPLLLSNYKTSEIRCLD